MEKMTYKTAIAYTLTLELPEDVREKMEALLATYEKKSGVTKKLTKTQLANIPLKSAIDDYMTNHPLAVLTISEMIEKIPALEGLSVNKVSALVRGLVTEGKVIRHEEKRKAYFQHTSEETVVEIDA